jgi:hypothetical protein
MVWRSTVAPVASLEDWSAMLSAGVDSGPAQDAQDDSDGHVPSPFTTCFGYSVRSALPFPLQSLRRGTGTPLYVTVDAEEPRPDREAVLVWSEWDKPIVELYDLDTSYLVWIDQIGWFRIDPEGPSIAVSSTASGPRLEARILGLPTALCFMRRGDQSVHAAAVEVEGGALILAAPGRYGKSTLASAFLQAGGRPLSEDTTCLRASPTPSILPGPAVLRIRPDVHERIQFPHTRILAEDPDRVYLAVDESARGDDAPVPLRGVVFLRRSEGELEIERIPPEKAFPDLWTLSFHLPNDGDRARCFATIAEVARQVPVWNLHRRLSFDGLPEVVDAIISTCLTG